MLGIDSLNMIFAACLGGLIGGTLCALAHKELNKFNMRMLEKHWNKDIKYFRCRLEAVDQKISTISVNNPVVNMPARKPRKGCKKQGNFAQGV